MTEQNLLENLEIISKNNYELSDKHNLMELTNVMLTYIGSTNSLLRDELIYYTFYQWILEKKYYHDDQLRYILKNSLNENHLYYNLGAYGDDSVFTRSFSVLILPLILIRNRSEVFLKDDEIKGIKDKILKYFLDENDLRGYVEDKGWAHAIAHAADAIDDIVQYEMIDHGDLIEILEAIKIKMSVNHYVYVNEEDERIITAVVKILKRNVLTEQEVIEWIKSFKELTLPNKNPNYHNFIINIKGFLRSLYFRLNKDNNLLKYQEVIMESLNHINRFN